MLSIIINFAPVFIWYKMENPLYYIDVTESGRCFIINTSIHVWKYMHEAMHTVWFYHLLFSSLKICSCIFFILQLEQSKITKKKKKKLHRRIPI